MNFEITTFSIDEYDAMVEVWNLAGLPSKPKGRDSRPSIEVQMADDPGMFLCARANGRMVGVVIASLDGRRGYINRLAVVPEFQRQGIARALMDACEALFRSKGVPIMTLLIEDKNPDSLVFFSAIGYRIHDNMIYVSKRAKGDLW